MNTQNFTPFTKDESKSIMAKRHIVPPRKQLYTSGGVKVYMMTLPRNNYPWSEK